eukprot:502946-Prorocentrum_minimum.AAC.1
MPSKSIRAVLACESSKRARVPARAVTPKNKSSDVIFPGRMRAWQGQVNQSTDLPQLCDHAGILTNLVEFYPYPRVCGVQGALPAHRGQQRRRGHHHEPLPRLHPHTAGDCRRADADDVPLPGPGEQVRVI